MMEIQSKDYDAYAYVLLRFVCSGCAKEIDCPDEIDDLGDAYCRFIARKAEGDGWFINCGSLLCFCPECRWKAGL